MKFANNKIKFQKMKGSFLDSTLWLKSHPRPWCMGICGVSVLVYLVPITFNWFKFYPDQRV